VAFAEQPSGQPTAPAAQDHLRWPLQVSDSDAKQFRQQGYLVVRNAVDPGLLASMVPLLQRTFAAHMPKPDPEGGLLTDYAMSFVQMVNLRVFEPAIAPLVLAPRFGALAAQLLETEQVRVYAEDWLLKQPGERETGWHTDDSVFPFYPQGSATIWLPMQDVTADMGLLRIATGTHRWPRMLAESITEAGSAALAQAVAQAGCEVVEIPPLRRGDLCIHHGHAIHGAGSNQTTSRRDVLALHLFAGGARIVAPQTAIHQHQLANFGQGLAPGDLAASPLWPVIWPAGQSGVGGCDA
jgi:ectoine hydroxylase-related dioxygenase (phytanoyl-CoA dioxygenase family)